MNDPDRKKFIDTVAIIMAITVCLFIVIFFIKLIWVVVTF